MVRLTMRALGVPLAPPPPPTRIVTEGLHPAQQDRYNRKHQIGAYDPQHITRVETYRAFLVSMAPR